MAYWILTSILLNVPSSGGSSYRREEEGRAAPQPPYQKCGPSWTEILNYRLHESMPSLSCNIFVINMRNSMLILFDMFDE